MKTIMVMLLSTLLAAGCVDILNESSSTDNSENYEVGDDGNVTVTDAATGSETNITEQAAIEFDMAGRLVDGVLLPSEDELTEAIYEGM